MTKKVIWFFNEDEITLKDTNFAERFKREVLYYQMKH